MLIREIMTTNIVSIPSTTSLANARSIMDVHQVKRLPVVDKEKLVGIVTKNALDKAGPSAITAFSKQELNYLLQKLTVKEVMSTDLATLSPDVSIDEAVALAQKSKVRSFLVTENSRLIGVVTTNDFFYKVLSPMLSVSKPASVVCVH